jgi:hypothetical protein
MEFRYLISKRHKGAKAPVRLEPMDGRGPELRAELSKVGDGQIIKCLLYITYPSYKELNPSPV